MSKDLNNVLIKYVMAIALFCSYQTAAAQEISSFTLIDAENNIEIGVLSSNDTINISDYNTDKFTIIANTLGSIGSVVFRLDGEIIKAENSAPYSLFGSSVTGYNPWTPELKTYTITASAHSLPVGQGTILNTYSIDLTFTGQEIEEPIGLATYSLVLINADTDEDIAEITEGSVFVLEEIGTSNLNIRAESAPETESVVFGYQEEPKYHTENLIEYAIGANDDDDYRPWIPDLGANTVTATAFSKDNGTGISGNSLTLNFEIIEITPEPYTPFVMRINSGGASVVLNDSISFVADTLFTGNGKSYTNNNIIDFLETTHDSIYKTERTTNGALQSFGYNIPVIDGEYEVLLHFAELYWGATGGGIGAEGKRVFSVSIEGEDVLTDYDLNDETEPMTAIIKSFLITVIDGELNIDFGASVDQPKVSAIEIHEIQPIIDPLDCDWETLADALIPKLEAQSVKANGKLYIIGGSLTDSTVTSSTEIYDPAEDTWSNASPMPTSVTQMSAVSAAENIWVIAGFETDSLSLATTKVQVYNTVLDSWSIGPDLPSARAAGAATYNKGKIHFFGGVTNDSAVANDHFILDINNIVAGWQSAAPLPTPTSHLAAATVAGKIYAIGGQIGFGAAAEDQVFVSEYDTETDSWLTKADLPSPRSHFDAAIMVRDQKIIIAGGKSGTTILNDISEFNPELNIWTERCKMPFNLVAASAKIFGDQLIITNGGEDGSCCPKSTTFSMYLEPQLEVPEEKEEEEISVLVYHETGEFRHSSINAGIDMITSFGEELGWKVTESQTSDIFVTDSLSTYDVVVWLNTTGDDILTLTEQSAFEGFIQNGGGFIGIHAATDTYRNGSWPWYNDLVGAIVQVSPYHTANNTNATIDIVGEHSTVSHLGTEWNKNDEYYYWERNGGYLFEGNINLLQVRATGINSYDAARPVTWYKEYDGGRSFYTALGHNAQDYDTNEGFRTMLQEAIIWAAENEALEVADPEPELNTPAEENSVVLFPNPVLDFLSVSPEIFTETNVTGQIQIFSMDGTLMAQKTISLDDHQINLSDLPMGYYAVTIQVGTITEQHLIYKK